MKRKLILMGCYLAALLLLGIMVAPYLFWKYLPTARMDVVILDKTVPVTDYREHLGLMWALNHYKITDKENNSVFLYDQDYYGFFPQEGDLFTVRELPELSHKPDLIYLADAYGVYEDDYLKENLQGTKSNLVYGGLTYEDLSAIRQGLGGGNTIIGEFNIASSPTNQVVREGVGGIFGVQWKGWNGRYFKELAKGVEVPVWMPEDYEEQYNKPWDFKGAGLVLVSEDERLIVLEQGKHLGKNKLQLFFADEYKTEFGVSKNVPYYYWFEILEAMPGREIIANYRLDLTDEGKMLYKEVGLPEVFPAVVRFRNTQYTSYYYAGDFADLHFASRWWNLFGFAEMRKILCLDNAENNELFYWQAYVPMKKKIINDLKIAQAEKDSQPKEEVLYSRVEGKMFQVYKQGEWKDIFVKGVNIGPALPGKWFTEFTKDEKIFLEWFELLGKMNANSIRIYTLLPPEFYNTLLYYNQQHPDNVLWLFQEIWPEEHPPNEDYLAADYMDAYRQEIEYIIDAIHGKANIAARKGRAYGVYTSDVSPYVLGYLVGRELEPEEVISTDTKNPGYFFEGEYLRGTQKATPTEAWLAESCDYLLSYEEKEYNTQHPAGIVSWPTLDPPQHDSEWDVHNDKSKEYNDKASVNINNIDIGPKMKAGFFGAYHIYPNYPDFMNNELPYQKYHDEEGRFMYGGYLREFIAQHKKYPALVAEFGLATGMGNAHSNPDGYHHGGKTEEEQGEGTVRMIKTIAQEGYAGGLIFEWIDEWAKKTWITEPYMIPYERNVFWHNAIDPEQNYGIIAVEPLPPKQKVNIEGNGSIKSLGLSANEAFLYVDIFLEKPLDFTTEKLLIGLDTYDRERGEVRHSSYKNLEFPSGVEFVIEINSNSQARILVQPQYNIANNRYASVASNKGIFEEISPLINKARVTKDRRKIKAVYQEGSVLNYGDFTDNNHNHWHIEGDTIHLRIPWGKINFTDPSLYNVLDDPRINFTNPLRDELKTTVSDGVVAAPVIVNTKTKQVQEMISNLYKPYMWEKWELPNYQMRPKESYFIIGEYFKNI